MINENVSALIINKMSNAQYERELAAGNIKENELYLTPDENNLATSTEDGLMSAADKTKLDAIEEGAQANVQSDWNQNDETADDYIKNKTHYDNREIVSEQESISLTFDGNLEGREIVDLGGDGYFYMVKLSDTPLTKDKIIGGTVKGKNIDGAEIFNQIFTEEMILEESESYIFAGGAIICVVYDDNTDIHGDIYSKGIWVSYITGTGYTSSFTNTVTTEKVLGGELKKIDEKFLPDSVCFDLSDEELLQLLMDTNIVDPAANSAGAIYVDNNNKVYVL